MNTRPKFPTGVIIALLAAYSLPYFALGQAVFVPPPTTPKTTSQRTAMTPTKSSLIFDTDQKALYVGDGTTVGGLQTVIPNGAITGTNTFFDTQRITLTDATHQGLIIKTAATPTANILEAQNSSGTIVTQITAAGRVGIGVGSSPGTAADLDVVGQIRASDTVGGSVGTIVFGNNSARYLRGSSAEIQFGTAVSTLHLLNTTTATLLSEAPSGSTAFILSANTSHTSGKLLDIQNAGTPRFSVDFSGKATISTNSPGGLTITESSQGVPQIAMSGVAKTWNLQVQGNSNDDFYIRNVTDTRNVITATSSGLVGVGTQLGSQFSVLVGSASTKGMIIRGTTGQTASIFDVQDNVGALKLSISQSGTIYFASGIDNIYSNVTGIVSTDSKLEVGAGLVVNRQQLYSNSLTPLRVRSSVSQTGNLQAWEDATGGILALVDSAGRVGVGVGSSPGVGSELSVIGQIQVSNTSGAAFGTIYFGNSVNRSIRGNSAELQIGATLDTISYLGTSTAKIKSAAPDGTTAVVLNAGTSHTSGNLLDVQNAGVSQFHVDFGGGIGASSEQIIITNASTKGLIVKGASSQTANLLELQNNSSGVIFSVAANGNATLNTTALGGLNITESSLGVPHLGLIGVTKQWNLQVQGNSNDDWYLNNITDGRTVISATTAGLVGIGTQLGSQFSVLVGSASRTGSIIRAAASQTANLTEWQTSIGAAMVSVAASGKLTVNTTGVSPLIQVQNGSGEDLTSGSAFAITCIITNTPTSASTADIRGGNFTPSWGGTANSPSGGLTGFYSQPTSNVSGAGHLGFHRGIFTNTLHNGTGTVDDLRAVFAQTSSQGGGTITNAYGVYTASANFNASIMTNYTGVYISSCTTAGGSSVGTQYGIQIENMTGATTNFAIKTGTGLVSFGDQVQVAASSSSTKGLIVKAATGQTANLVEVTNSTSDIFVSVGPNGILKVNGTTSDFNGLVVDTALNRVGIMKYPGEFPALVAGNASLLSLGHRTDSDDVTAALGTFRKDFVIASTGLTAIGGGVTSPGAQLQVTAGSASTKGMVVKAATSPSVNIVEVQDNSSSILVSVGPNGAFSGSMDTMAYATSISLDVTSGNLHKTTTVDATGNATINASGVGVAGQSITLLITNDATAPKTITFGTNFVSSGPLVGTASKSALITFWSDGTSWYESARTTGL